MVASVGSAVVNPASSSWAVIRPADPPIPLPLATTTVAPSVTSAGTVVDVVVVVDDVDDVDVTSTGSGVVVADPSSLPLHAATRRPTARRTGAIRADMSTSLPHVGCRVVPDGRDGADGGTVTGHGDRTQRPDTGPVRPVCQTHAMPLVLIDKSDGVATLTLNNPDERNTLTAPMVDEITAAMDDIEADEAIGAIVVTGAAPAFCAGANLGNLSEATGESLGKIYEGFLRIARSPLPTLAAVNGAAVGAGANLALGCDVRIMADEARLDTRFLQLGIHPGGGHTWMFRRIAGPQAAMAAVVFGQVLDGKEAERVGLAYRSVPRDDLASFAHDFAAGAASAPRELAITTKATILAMADVADHPAAVQRELEPQLWSTQQPWFAERMAALKAKISSKKS